MTDKRKNRIFRSERRDIKYPLWRKKVDRSIFYEQMILIPKAYEGFWDIPNYFNGVHSKSDVKSAVPIQFDGNTYDGNIVQFQAKKRKDYRIQFGSDLCEIFKHRYSMSFMRELERSIRKTPKDKKSAVAIEEEIPFWEFLDIEFDAATRTLYFTCHYRQLPFFPDLFGKLADETILQNIELEIQGKTKASSSVWRERKELNKQLDAVNVIYFLLDDVNQELYIGEAISLQKRLSVNRPEIPNWTHYRYEVLPPELANFRKYIQNVLIRSLMYLIPCSAFSGSAKCVSNWTLTNKRDT